MEKCVEGEEIEQINKQTIKDGGERKKEEKKQKKKMKGEKDRK